jgi:CBS domain-containing protein
MKCPLCDFDNLEGADSCARCGADLRDGELPAGSDIERAMLRCPLGDLATEMHVEVPPDRSVRDTVREMLDGGHYCALVVEEGVITGIFTERDLLFRLGNKFNELADSPIRDYMTPDPATLNHDVPIAFGLNRMMVGGYRHIPIERDGTPAGTVSVREVLAYLTRQFGDVITTGAAK